MEAYRLVQHLAQALKEMFCEMSTVHFVLLCHMVVFTVVMECQQLDRTDARLCIFLRVVELAVAVDCILIVTHHLTRLSESNQIPTMVVYQMPIVIGPLSEFELTRLMLKDNTTAAANNFLVGCVYVKPLVAGALCFTLNALHGGGPETQLQAMISSDVPNFYLWIWLSLALYAYRLGLQARPMLATVAGNSLWLARGVPVLLVLSICFTCYFWRRHAGRPRANASDECDASHHSEWAMLLAGLVLLRLLAVHLVHSVWKQMQSATWTVEKDGTWTSIGTVIEFVLLPLAVSAVDHLAYITTTYQKDMEWAWASLFQSTMQTLLLMRPLFTLMGHDLDPRSGCVSIGLCFFGIALWLSLRNASHESSLPATRIRIADLRRTAQRINSFSGVLGTDGYLCNLSRFFRGIHIAVDVKLGTRIVASQAPSREMSLAANNAVQ